MRLTTWAVSALPSIFAGSITQKHKNRPNRASSAKGVKRSLISEHAQYGPLPSRHLLVRTCFHLEKSGVRAWMIYLAIGLWLSEPRLQLSCTVVSFMSLTTNPPGGPGGPSRKRITIKELTVLH